MSNITQQGMADKDNPNQNNTQYDIFYYRYNRSIVLRFDLSSIPAGVTVRRAVLRFFYDTDFYDAGKTGVNQPIFRIDDPSNTGMWTEGVFTYNHKRAGVPWSGASGNISTVYGPKIGDMYFKNWYQGSQSYLESDITAGAQYWVSTPGKNLGLIMDCAPTFNKRIASKAHANAALRPYLEVTYEAPQTESIPQATQAKTTFSDGQTFITWKEAATGKDETSYRIYRSTSPITTANLDAAEFVDEVYQGSSYLSDTITIKQPDLAPIGVTLASDSGLYVYTARASQNAYYAVTTVVEGNENRTITSGANATTTAAGESVQPPRPFLFNRHGFGYYTGLVVWLGRFNSLNPGDPYGYDSRKSAPFFFSIAEPMNFVPGRMYPLTIFLHASGQNYFASEEGRDNSRYYSPENYGGYTIQINDQPRLIVKKADGTLVDLGNFLEVNFWGTSFYAGWNSNYEPCGISNGLRKSFNIAKPFEQGKSVMYSEKSMRYVVDWMRNRSSWARQIDPNRLYITGGSMGGCGSLAFAMHHPDIVTAADAYIGRTAIYYLNNYSFGSHAAFGSKEMAIPTPEGEDVYTHLDIAAYLRAHPSNNYPPLRIRNGKQDQTVFWSTHPDFFKAAQEVGIYIAAYFDQAGHTTADPLSDFPEFVNNRYFPRDQSLPYFNPFQFRSNKSYPAFIDFSLNDDPGNGDPNSGAPRGGINRFIRWDMDSVQDDLKRWAATVYLYDFTPVNTATVTIIPRNTQNLVHAAGSQYSWRMTRESDGATLQSGTASRGADGRIRIPNLQVSKERRRLIIDLNPTGDATAPSTPGGLTATIIGPGQVRLNWTAATDNTGVLGYRVFRDSVGAVKTVTGTQAVIAGLSPGATYTFRVTAFDAAGNESGQSAAVQAVMPGVSGNEPPVFGNIPNPTIGRGELLALNINAVDPDDFNLSYSASNLPVGARFDVTTHQFRWLPNYQQAGNHNVTFSVTDGFSTVQKTITITVTAAAPQPTIESIETYGAFISGGVNVKISKADGNEQGRLYIKRAIDPDTAYKEAHRFVRYDVNHMASSLFDLTAGTQYTVKVVLEDPEAQNRESVATLITRPEWSLPSPTRVVNVSNDAQLSAAIAAAVAGDHILLAPGAYAANVAIDGKSGTPGKPIVIKSKETTNRALLTGGLAVRNGGYVTVTGLELRGGGGIKVRGAHHVEIVDNYIRDAGGTVDSYMIHLSHNELIPGADKNFYALIMNNELTDDNNSNSRLEYGAFPDQTYYGIKQDDGVGGMTIIRGNIIRGVADGISPGGDEGENPILSPDDFDVLNTWTNQNLDIYDNKIYSVSDDCIETDGHMVNGRIFRNTLGYCVNAISFAPVYPGPYFVVRNTIHGYREQSVKLNTAVTGITRNIYIYHNTIKQASNATYAIYRGMPTRNENVVWRNNLVVSTGRVIDTDIGSNSPGDWYHKNHDFDYNLYYSPLPQNAGFTLFKWGYSDYGDNRRYESFAAFKAGTANPNEVTFTVPGQRVISQEANGTFGDPRLVSTALSGFPATSMLVSLTPSQGSLAIDRGVVLPGINDGYGGTNPDVGAIESNGILPPPPPDPGTETNAPLKLEDIDTLSAPVGAYVTIYGTGFGNFGPPSGMVIIGGVPVTEYKRWTDNRIEFQVPQNAVSGSIVVKVGFQVSLSKNFTVRPGNIYYVEGQSGGANDSNPGTEIQPWRTIAHAMSRLQAGDTLYVGSGLYQELFLPANNGSPGLPIMIKARPGTRPTLDGATLVGRPDGIRLESKNNIIFSGFELRNFTNAVTVISGSNNCHFFDIDGGFGRGGAYLYDAGAINFAWSRFHHNIDFGVAIRNYCNGIQFNDCSVEENGTLDGGGFEAEFTVQNVAFRHCTSRNNAGEGFDIKAGGITLDGSSAIHNTTGFSIWRATKLENCEAFDNVTAGIALNRFPEDNPSYQVINCTVAGAHALAGIDIQAGVAATILNTISVGSLGPAIRVQGSSPIPVIDYCVLQTSGPPGTPVVSVNGVPLGPSQEAGQSSGIGLNSVVLAGIQPSSLFEDYGAGILELAAGSQARNIGTTAGAPAYDRMRRLRGMPDGRYDIGAYEYAYIDNAADDSWLQSGL